MLTFLSREPHVMWQRFHPKPLQLLSGRANFTQSLRDQIHSVDDDGIEASIRLSLKPIPSIS
jgi:hypothetical protein